MVSSVVMLWLIVIQCLFEDVVHLNNISLAGSDLDMVSYLELA